MGQLCELSKDMGTEALPGICAALKVFRKDRLTKCLMMDKELARGRWAESWVQDLEMKCLITSSWDKRQRGFDRALIFEPQFPHLLTTQDCHLFFLKNSLAPSK